MTRAEASQSYVNLEMEQNFQVGERVRILRAAKDYEAGWENGWVDDMTKNVGKIGTISSGWGSEEYATGLPVQVDGGDTWKYPWFVLEKVAEERPLKTYYKVFKREVSGDGDMSGVLCSATKYGQWNYTRMGNVAPPDRPFTCFGTYGEALTFLSRMNLGVPKEELNREIWSITSRDIAEMPDNFPWPEGTIGCLRFEFGECLYKPSHKETFTFAAAITVTVVDGSVARRAVNVETVTRPGTMSKNGQMAYNSISNRTNLF